MSTTPEEKAAWARKNLSKMYIRLSIEYQKAKVQLASATTSEDRISATQSLLMWQVNLALLDVLFTGDYE